VSEVAAIEAPSGKDAAYENFPVGSWLLDARLRPHIAIFYAFARAADDIADSPVLAPADKVARLRAFGEVLIGERVAGPGLEKAGRMRDSLRTSGVPARHCLDLLEAFTLDATKLRYRDWEDLMGYCMLSAAPVGRYLLDLHGEDRAGFAASDALCMALQVLNHLQDCAADFRDLDRVYIPEPWFAEVGLSVADLDYGRTTPALRQVLDRALDGVDVLMAQAAMLPVALKSRRLAMESAVIVRIARDLSKALRRRDPLGPRVVLSKPRFAWCALRGAVAGLFAPIGR